MEKNIANELKKLDIEMGRKLFSIAKENKIQMPPSPLQGRIIDFLLINKGKDICQKDLEDTLDVSKATVSATLRTMESTGIIKRATSKKDARSKKIILTKKSEKVHQEMSQIFEKLNNELVNGFSNEEIERLFYLIDKLRHNIQS